MIWKRSEEARRLRYMEIISDGDSKTTAILNENEPYGSGLTIYKHECVGHVGSEHVLPRRKPWQGIEFHGRR